MIYTINDDQYVILLCQRVNQPIGDLYTSCIDWQTLKKTTENLVAIFKELNIPQGHPVIVQAGSSEAGKELAAKTADVVFTA